jgi:hypothetical protein
MRCEICHENLRRDEWRSHHQTVHANYGQWFRRWNRRFYGVVILCLPILIILYYLMQVYGGLYVVAGGAFVLAFAGWGFYQFQLFFRTRQSFVREWWKSHPLSQ